MTKIPSEAAVYFPASVSWVGEPWGREFLQVWEISLPHDWLWIPRDDWTREKKVSRRISERRRCVLFKFGEKIKKKKKMRLPGVEPGSIAWKAIILTVGLQTPR